MVGNQKSPKRNRKLTFTWKATKVIYLCNSTIRHSWFILVWKPLYITGLNLNWSLWKSGKLFEASFLNSATEIWSNGDKISFSRQIWCRVNVMPFRWKIKSDRKNIKRIKKRKTMGLSAWKQKRHFLVKYSMRQRCLCLYVYLDVAFWMASFCCYACIK